MYFGYYSFKVLGFERIIKHKLHILRVIVREREETNIQFSTQFKATLVSNLKNS